jgi:hypothetical protein
MVDGGWVNSSDFLSTIIRRSSFMKFSWLWPFRLKDQDPLDLAKVDAAAIIRKARRLRFRVRRGAVADLAGAYVGAGVRGASTL